MRERETETAAKQLMASHKNRLSWREIRCRVVETATSLTKEIGGIPEG